MDKMQDYNYTEAVKTIKTAILQSQYMAVKTVNSSQLSLYYGIGEYVSLNSRKGFWGTNAIENISEQLQKELPGLRGFSIANIKFMRQFYEAWSTETKSLTGVSEMRSNQSLTAISEIDAFQLIGKIDDDAQRLKLSDFLSLGFTHHMIIVREVKTVEERTFYIRQAVLNKWNKQLLKEYIKKDLFHHQGSLSNNFVNTITDTRSALKAIEMFKDEYLLDYINVEELGERDKEDIDERVIEQAIIHNVKKFIMTFGRDFTFVGNQYHLEVFGVNHFSDLLFFNRELNALVCVELKRGDFKASYLGQLTTYLRILDDQVRKPHENPSIGIILCKSANKEYVEYVIQDYEKPMGVATYRTLDDMPEKLRKALPEVEELKKLL
ncbi:MAG: PDDEXK nuclease domain-containing protein [Bacteroides sp.]|nr:PDDEXK nuclease domain-containing protein [Bacteroides sp.]